MKNLDEDINRIEEFVQVSIDKFKSEAGKPSSIGIYCCPWAGWLTTNFNLEKTLSETQNNCPDFQFVEFDFLELLDWQEEYEQEKPVFEIQSVKFNHDHDMGDEKLNELIFNYLTPIVIRLKHKNNSDFLLQLLDSRFFRII